MNKYNLEEIMKMAIALEVFVAYDNKDADLVYSSEHIRFGEGFVKWYLGFTHDQQPTNTVKFCTHIINCYDEFIKGNHKI